jgi:ATP-dependent RNA helicase RhlB
VLDEADRMFDLGFIKDIRFLLRRMPERTTRQTLLFSATLSHRVLELAYEHMNEPEKLVVETESITAARVRQIVYFPSNEEKLPLLLGLLSRSEGARTMVFVNTKSWVERVARALERAGYLVGVLSGDVPQKKRESLLKKFQAGQLELLVATDVAARGLHIDGVSHVYNYDLPFDAEDYVHRIGRTARLGAEGDAISFACEMYAMGLPDIEAFIEQKIPVGQVTPELLTALPRPERARPAEGESVGEIFREVREAQAAEGGRGRSGRGTGPTGGRRDARRGEGRRGEGGGERSEAGPRRRRPRRESEAGDASQAASEVPITSVPAEAPPGAEAQASAAEPRKRRRRRGGRGRKHHEDGAAAADGASNPRSGAAARGEGGKRQTVTAEVPPVPGSPAQTEPAKGGGLLARIGRSLRSLIKRPPSGRH